MASFLFVHFLFWAFPSVFETWNAQVIDRLFVFRSSVPSLQPFYDSTIVHVDLSDNTIASLGNFAVSRGQYAQVVRNLGTMHTAAQAWDFIFPRRPALQPEERRQDEAFAAATGEAGSAYFGLKFDLMLNEPIRRKPVTTAGDLAYLSRTTWNPVVEGEAEELYRASNPIVTTSEIAGGSRGVGYLSLKFDRDGVFRRAPLIVRYEDALYPSFAFRVACDYLGVTPDRVIIRAGESIILKGARKPGEDPHDISIPIDVHGSALINWVGPWERMVHYDFADILKSSDDRDEMEMLTEFLEGKIVVVSEVATGSADVGPVPTDNDFPLSGLHANVIHTILTNNFLREMTGWRMMLIESVVAILLIVLAVGLSSRLLSGGMILLMLIYLATAAALFLYAGVIVNFLRPTLLIVFGMFSILGYRYFNEEKNKEVLRRSFESYFPPSVVKRIMANPDLITAGGQKKELTIMFTDIKSFTTYSSTLSPDEIQRMLNEYFGAMIEIVFKYEGTVDKFIGDGLMVFFGDPEPQPDHALRCVRAAIEMQRKTRELKAAWEAKGRFPIRIRIGINTGPVVVGNMGSARRLSYTVLGADVNLAQRLEANAPVEGIIISQRTYELVKNNVLTRPLQPIHAKGLDQPIPVWEIPVDKEPGE